MYSAYIALPYEAPKTSLRKVERSEKSEKSPHTQTSIRQTGQNVDRGDLSDKRLDPDGFHWTMWLTESVQAHNPSVSHQLSVAESVV